MVDPNEPATRARNRSIAIIVGALLALTLAQAIGFAFGQIYGDLAVYLAIPVVVYCSFRLGRIAAESRLFVAGLAGFGLSAFYWEVNNLFLIWYRMDITPIENFDWRSYLTFYDGLRLVSFLLSGISGGVGYFTQTLSEQRQGR